MRTLISALIFLALSVALVSLLNQGNGYVLFGYGEWTVEGSLALFILFDLVLFLLLYYAIRAWARIWSTPERLQDWKKRRQARRARNSLANGLMDLAAGNWKSAEQKLLKHVDSADKPLLNYLAAAHATQQQGAIEKRDNYLQLAHKSMPSADIAVTLTQAELQLSNHQMEQALATLMHLRKIAPTNGHVLKLLKELYLQLGDWSQLLQLLPDLRKRDVMSRGELDDLELKSHVELMRQTAAGKTQEDLDAAWRNTPKRLRNHGDMVLIYARYLLDNQAEERAERLLMDAILDKWDERLVELYGLLGEINPASQLSRAESWLSQHGQSPVLLLTLARICLRDKLWGKARSYLEASIGVRPTPEAHLELGTLLLQMGESELALDNFRAGLELSASGPKARSWRYDGRKTQADSDIRTPSSALRQPMDAPLPVSDETN
jgi:HemY protein